MESQKVVYSPTPETYIQADTATFKDLVQKLTGGYAHRLRPKANVFRRSPFKFQEWRKHSLRYLELIKLGVESTENSLYNTRSNDKFLPVKDPMTPVERDSESHKRTVTGLPLSEEGRAIAEKGFYLHASPGKAELPVLLTLFPLNSA